MASKTVLWNVGQRYLSGEKRYEVGVSALDLPNEYHRVLQIRSITAKAAARRYIRNNLGHNIASAALETDHPWYGRERPNKKEIQKHGGDDKKTATIVVLK